MSKEVDNMLVWRHAEQTDISATKESSVGGYSHTSINGYWFIKKATELWGPMGSGWGVEIKEERFDKGAPIIVSIGGVEQVLCETLTHVIRIELWHGSRDNKIPSFGVTPYVYQSKFGAKTDPEAPKKSMTDAIKKALSLLGFASDVYSGYFEDANYLGELQNKQFLEKAQNIEEEKVRQAKEYDEWLEKHIEYINTAKTLNELEKLFVLVVKKCRSRGDESGEKKASIAKEKTKTKLKRKENETT